MAVVAGGRFESFFEAQSARLARLFDSPQFRAEELRAKGEEERGRVAALRSIAEAVAEFESQKPSLDANIAEAEAAHKRATAQLLAATTKLRSDVLARSTAKLQADAIQREHRSFLRATAPACIDDFKRELESLQAKVSRLGPRRELRTTAERHEGSGALMKVEASNAPAIREVMISIFAARKATSELHETTATEADALSAIARLRQSIPLDRLNEIPEAPVVAERPAHRRRLITGRPVEAQ